MLFLIFKAKEAVEVIEASDIIMSVEFIEATEVFITAQILKINYLMAKITLAFGPFWQNRSFRQQRWRAAIAAALTL